MRWLLLLSLFLTQLAWADPAWLVRDTQLRDKPSFSAKRVKPLARGAEVDFIKRSGGWIQVGVPDGKKVKKGWLRSYEVRQDKQYASISSEEGQGQSSAIKTLARSTSSLFGSRASETADQNVVATIGVRGLSEEDLNKAKPDFDRVDDMAKWVVSKKKAKSFAKTVKLDEQKIKYIEVKDGEKD